MDACENCWAKSAVSCDILQTKLSGKLTARKVTGIRKVELHGESKDRLEASMNNIDHFCSAMMHKPTHSRKYLRL